MIYFNKKDSVADSIKDIMEKKELSPKQKEIAKMSPPADKIDAGDLSKLRAGHKTVKEEEVHEEIDPKSRTKDTASGRKKTDQTDDVGPGSDGKSTKVKYRGGPMATSEGFTLRTFKEKYEDNSIYDQMINEVLSKDASAGQWIHDFVHSDNPKFAGKSKEQRKKQALAAYYAKQHNEETEEAESLIENYEMINEVLSKDASAGQWIHDFVHSDNPKFAGKSKEQRKKQALAAYYAKQRNEEVVLEGSTSKEKQKTPYRDINSPEYRAAADKQKQQMAKDKTAEPGKKLLDKIEKKGVAEEVEQIDEELKTKTAYVPYVYTDKHGSGFGGYDVHYSKEADAHAHVAKHGHIDNNGKKGWVEKHEIAKHPSGRWVDANHMRRHGVSEEVEQIDELSKTTLQSYTDKAAQDAVDNAVKSSKHAQIAIGASKTGADRLVKANQKIADKAQGRAEKRISGLFSANKRMNKEEIEQVEENSPFDWKKPREPEVKGGSGVKKGTRYGGSAQKSKPEQDDEEPKKKVTESKRTDTDNVPFDPPFNTTSDPVVTDKSGAKHTPMSRVKHLAKLAMKRVKKDVQGK